jgi:RimJ/RimL family protein N-acetyltransferase
MTASPRVGFSNVYATANSYQVLYDLLKERTKEQSISHYSMPTMAEHIAFVRTNPYIGWYLIESAPPAPKAWVGAIYLTPKREIGIFIFREHQGNGYATAALATLRRMHPGRILANINPHNGPSLEFFRKHGGREIQITLELP